MRSRLTLFAAVCVAALALVPSANAATILAFGQLTSSDFVEATVSNGTTTLNTDGGVGSVVSIPIVITQLGATSGLNLSAFETFTPALVSTSPVTAGGNQAGFTGTIVISGAPNGAGQNILTAAIINGHLVANGAAGGFDAASFTTNGGLPTTVTLTSANGAVEAVLGGPGPVPGAASLSLVNITPVQSGAGFVSFTGQNTGNFSTVAIPEPASFISAGTAILAGFGCFGWARRKSSSQA
jgi:hypothetical protein